MDDAFDLPAWNVSTHARVEFGSMLGELVAPSGLLALIAAQLVGAALGAALTEFFYPRPGVVPEPLDLPDPVHRPEGTP